MGGQWAGSVCSQSHRTLGSPVQLAALDKALSSFPVLGPFFSLRDPHTLPKDNSTAGESLSLSDVFLKCKWTLLPNAQGCILFMHTTFLNLINIYCNPKIVTDSKWEKEQGEKEERERWIFTVHCPLLLWIKALVGPVLALALGWVWGEEANRLLWATQMLCDADVAQEDSGLSRQATGKESRWPGAQTIHKRNNNKRPSPVVPRPHLLTPLSPHASFSATSSILLQLTRADLGAQGQICRHLLNHWSPSSFSRTRTLLQGVFDTTSSVHDLVLNILSPEPDEMCIQLPHDAFLIIYLL